MATLSQARRPTSRCFLQFAALEPTSADNREGNVQHPGERGSIMKKGFSLISDLPTPDRPTLTMDPCIHHGDPVITGTAVRADVIAEMVAAGDSVEIIMNDHQLSREQVLLACWFLMQAISRKNSSRRNKEEQEIFAAWSKWYKSSCPLFYFGDANEVALPPSVQAHGTTSQSNAQGDLSPW